MDNPKDIVRQRYPDANARQYLCAGWFVIPRRGAYSLEREGWLGHGENEAAAWFAAAREIS